MKHEVSLNVSQLPDHPFAAMDILRPLPETSSGKQHVVNMTDRFSKLTSSIYTKKHIFPHLATIFFDNQVVQYGILGYSLTKNSMNIQQIIYDFIAFLRVMRLTIIAYHQLTNREVKQYNCTLCERLCHFDFK